MGVEKYEPKQDPGNLIMNSDSPLITVVGKWCSFPEIQGLRLQNLQMNREMNRQMNQQMNLLSQFLVKDIGHIDLLRPTPAFLAYSPPEMGEAKLDRSAIRHIKADSSHFDYQISNSLLCFIQ
jgi:hypothetical protein